MTRSRGPISPLKRAFSRMVADIRESIMTGQLGIGDCLPSEATLAADYGISINSVRRGIDILIEDGIVERRHGSGMYVQGIPAPTVQPLVRRDTVAVYFDHKLYSYHPFWSEMRRGVREGLARFGWKVLDLEEFAPKTAFERAYPDIPPADHELIWVERKYMTDFLASHQELAGGIFGYSTVCAFARELEGRMPFVVPTHNDKYPFVDMDIAGETVRAVQEILRMGSRRILVIGAKTAEAEAAARKAAHMLDCAPPEKVVGATTQYASTYSRYITESHALTQQLLKEHADIDGVVVTSDFEAQGAFDALAEARRLDMPAVAIVNLESRLHTPLPYTAIVLDGRQKGVMLAELLQQYIATPESAAAHLWLRGSIRTPRRR